ncbi:ImmA/IrrE family metallo-endopeptidase [Enterococcus sp. N249-2]
MKTYDNFHNNNAPNYAYSQKAAYETILQSKQNKLPLSIKKIIKSFPNLHLQKYTVFAKKRNLSMQEVYDLLDSEEGCLWKRGDGQYIILYNNQIENKGRIRFTLAHELGHFILQHNERTERTILARYSLTNLEHDIFEKEANYFARRLLAPIPLVDLYTTSWKKITAGCIEHAFETSYTVANYVIKDLTRRYQKANIIKEDHPIVDNFIDYIRSDSNSKICTLCSSVHRNSIKFCSICSNNVFIKSSAYNYTSYKMERKKAMIYSKIETDDKRNPIKCPRCESEQISATHIFCPYCSVILHNSCLGGKDNRFIELDSFGNHEEKSLIDQIQGGCQGYLDGGFRYCPQCGEETSYYRQGLLDSWETEKRQVQDPF